MLRKSWIVLLMSFLLMLSFGQSVWAFPDIQSDRNADKIAALQKAGILSGESDGTFKPQEKLTYAAGITMIVKGLDVSLARFLFNQAPKASDYFTNVEDDAWYSESFVIAQVNGLDIPKEVKPDQPMTREQFAHHLFRGMEANGEHAYNMMYILVKDESDITKPYLDSIQKLLITKIAELDNDGNFHPKAEITRSEAAGWLHGAIEFVKSVDVVPPQPEPDPLSEYKLESKAVTDQVREITVSAQAPHPGYGIRISSIYFDGNRAIIYTEPVLPDPDKVFPQVITEVRAVTYIGSDYEPVLPQSLGEPSGPDNID